MSKFSNPLQIFILIVVSMMMVGCVVAVNPDRWDDDYESSDNDSDWAERARVNSLAIDRLVIGRTLDSVLSSMGQPDIKEAFVRDGANYDVYYYRTHRVRSDYRTTKDEAVPLIFVDGELVGWGESAIQYATVKKG